jgi:hypothetical protein
MSIISELFSEKNANVIIGILAFLTVLWLVVFAIPSLFVSLFNTILGNLILLGLVILTGMYNPIAAICIAIIFFILVRFSHMSSTTNVKT